MHYFLTGATGFVGGRLARRLVDDGHEVTALVRSPGKATDLEEYGVELVAGDITDGSSMREAMAGTDGVFHLAAWYRLGVDDPELAEQVNVEGTRNVLELVDKLDIPKAVYTSTLAVNSDTHGVRVDEDYRFEGEHLSIYDETKWRAHYEVADPMADDGVPIVTVMPGVIYGPGDTSQMRDLWVDWLQGDLPVIPRETAYCWSHVDDVVDAHVAAMEEGEPGEDYIIAGEPYTLVEAMAIASNIVGKEAPRAISPRWFRGMAMLAGVAERFVSLPETYSSEALRVLGGATYLGDNAKAKRELGLQHRPFQDGLREVLEHEQAQLGLE
ncbi:NAD-dependent epimerase/dehydratase family protein [Haloarchaeobius sp. HME9146]|uniref:NAD-dependent epimerase/dehydratase family protein n=1 Tax=Haloarchaeobius sp. HME9146 TaxID=2978732 RepID=UPI0021C10CAB|nr:NAD-dependent epimerase/dehydratase family protein [Haloarchaeobius sp. HME9146]MCT9096952.1 NAD-dependent epimerase/dehydratase family protein [Haloarchaeobius sp. HME9146]